MAECVERMHDQPQRSAVGVVEGGMDRGAAG